MTPSQNTADMLAADRNAETLRGLIHACSPTTYLEGAQCASTLEYVVHAARPVTDRRIAAMGVER